MSDSHDAWFFIGIFVFIFLIWIATGGPLRPIAFSVPSFTHSTATSTPITRESSLQLPRSPYGIGDSHTVLSGSSGGGGSYYGSYSSGTAIPSSLAGITLGPPSPYRGIVTMSHYVSNASSSDPASEYIQLSVSQNAGTSINLTGWKLVSEATGRAAAVPGGTVVPTSGIVNWVRDIVLLPGERAFLISGRSPVGVSFRENKCVGYLTTFQRFSPSLPLNCPMPRDELATFYGTYYIRDATCVEYVNSLSRCEAVLFPPRSVSGGTISKTCKSFVVEHLNYNGCVATHRSDADFDGTAWHIYLGFDKHLWRARYEVVKLIDSNNKTVDAFSY